MDYFRILNLKKEPFSNSPDPDFFFQSRQHQGCLQKLELSVRMRRGLNVVIGDVGTGKTTLCRQLIRDFDDDADIETHLILDPDFSSAGEFLGAVAGIFGIPPASGDAWKVKEQIKKYIYLKGVDQQKNVVLIIDEGQKIPDFCLEILREFLNYETNANKLLQIVIFAQREFDGVLAAHANFADRVNLYHVLGPLNFRDTRRMIRYRVEKSSDSAADPPIFTFPALWAIYRATGGYPRKIINLCHQSVLAMIIQNRTKAGWFLVRSCVRRALVRPSASRMGRLTAALGIVLLLVAAATGGIYWQSEKGTREPSGPVPATMAVPGTVFSAGPADPLPEPATAVPQKAPLSEAAADGRDDALPPAVDDPAPEVPPASDPAPITVAAAGEVHALDVSDSDDAESAAAQTPVAPPAVLGEVVLKRREILSWMCIKVYGMYNRPVLRQVAEANPRMGDPDNLPAGSAIIFPARPQNVRPDEGSVWWVKIAETAVLTQAFDIVRGYRAKHAPIRIVPQWNPQDGLRFTVMLWRYYFDRVSAQRQLEQLPATASAHGRGVFSEWPAGTVFFADPYLGGGR